MNFKEFWRLKLKHSYECYYVRLILTDNGFPKIQYTIYWKNILSSNRGFIFDKISDTYLMLDNSERNIWQNIKQFLRKVHFVQRSPVKKPRISFEVLNLNRRISHPSASFNFYNVIIKHLYENTYLTWVPSPMASTFDFA